jgi:hypothetical protein
MKKPFIFVCDECRKIYACWGRYLENGQKFCQECLHKNCAKDIPRYIGYCPSCSRKIEEER